MDCQTTDRIAFQQRLFNRERLAQRWPAFNDVICSADAVEAAYGAVMRLPESQAKVARGVAAETLEFYNKVVRDGRYIDMLIDRPEEVAGKLDLKVSAEALEQIRVVNSIISPGAEVMNIAVVAVAVAVTVVIVKGSHPLEEIVIDQSGYLKM